MDEIRTFVRFPAAGFYQMGVNNNDDLRLTASETGTMTLKLTAPTNTPILCVAIATNVTQLLFGGALPLSPLSAQVYTPRPAATPTIPAASEQTPLCLVNSTLDRGRNQLHLCG